MADQTFEQLWKRIQLYAPSCPVPLAQEFVNTAYSKCQTLDRWSGLRQEYDFLLPQIYQVGSVDVVTGSTTVVGNGTAWDASMLYRQFMVDSITPIYTIIAVDDINQELTLDRAYGKVTATGKSYEIGQYYVEVPSDFREWDIVRDIDNNWKLHTNFQQRQIDVWDTKRQVTGVPWIVAPAPDRITTAGVVIQRYEFWPRPSPGPKTYSTRYIRKPALLANPDDRPIRPFRGDVIRKGALAELAMWPGTQTDPNPYFNLGLHSTLTKEFEEGMQQVWKIDQEGAQTAILYEDWEGVPYAPIDARYLQSHDIF
jgi:hypothetical protein